MPRYEYTDHEGNARVFSAPDWPAAIAFAYEQEYRCTGNQALADFASGTVEPSDERSRAA